MQDWLHGRATMLRYTYYVTCFVCAISRLVSYMYFESSQ